MKSPTNISTLPFEAPKRSMAQNLIYATCAVAVLTVIALLIAENISQRLDATHIDGMSEGNELAQRDFKGVIKREMFKAEKVQMCLGYYFNDDPERVAKSIQTVCKVSK